MLRFEVRLTQDGLRLDTTNVLTDPEQDELTRDIAGMLAQELFLILNYHFVLE